MEKVKHKGSALFKTVGIVMLVFSLLSFIVHAVLFIIVAQLISEISQTVPLFLSMLFGLLGAVFGMISGFYGVLFTNRPEKMNMCFIFNFAFLILTVVSVILCFIAFSRIFLAGVIGILTVALIFCLHLVCSYKCKQIEFEKSVSL